MKKIINGKKYDTDTAEFIGQYYTSDIGKSDFNYFEESLYMKKTCEFFLSGEGHGFTKYAGRHGNSYGWGSSIFPLTISEAKQWIEKHLSVEKYESLFGDVAE